MPLNKTPPMEIFCLCHWSYCFTFIPYCW